MLVLGIESTSHTSSIGISEDNRIISIKSHTYKPKKGGINPREAADHHRSYFPNLMDDLLSDTGFKIKDFDAIAFSVGPGLGPSLKVGASIARFLSLKYGKPLVPVNHGIAHLEVSRVYTGFSNPLYLYVSGGNTQLIINGRNNYVVVGETLDIGIGNFLDKIARDMGIPFPGGPVIEEMAREGKTLLDCPYIVRAMDVSFSGLYTFLKNKIGEVSLNDIAFNAQEYSFSALAEVAERAMAHYGIKELTLTGGVAMNKRLREILKIMSEERGWSFNTPPDQYLTDNGGMIALAGEKIAGEKRYDIKINQYDRLDSWNLNFIENYFHESPEGIGGESIISKGNLFSIDIIEKRRINRKYRVNELDRKIRAMRLRKEVRAYNYFHEIGINSPNVIYVDDDEFTMYIERINGTKLTNVLLSGIRPDLSKLGEYIGRIHKKFISHGDLTPSNIIFNGDFYIIDPSMAEFNSDLENLAVDIHLFKDSLKSIASDWENLFSNFLEGYSREIDSYPILERVKEIERRRRYIL